MKSLQRLGDTIDAFAPAEGPPPQRLWSFFRWCLAGSWPMLAVASTLSSLAGATEVVSALILGWVIDAAVTTGPGTFFQTHAVLLLWFIVFMV